MKKQLLVLVGALILCSNSFAQGYYHIKSKGVSSAVYNYWQPRTAGTTTTLLPIPSSDTYSAVQTLPFAWKFFGTAVTQYKVSDNGFLTFNTSETSNQTNPLALPSTSAPKNAIFAFWFNFSLASGGGIPDALASWTYGTSPNRVHVVQWLSVTHTGTSYASFAIRIYEGKGFDVVHNHIGTAVISGTVGVNNSDGTVGYTLAGSPNCAFVAPTTDQDFANMWVYTFRPAPQPANDIELTSLTLQKFVAKNTQMPIKGTITNYGSTNLSSFKLNYSVDNGPTVTMQLSGLNITATTGGVLGGVYSFTHNIPFVGTVSSNSTIKVWTTLPNAGVDGDTTNDVLTGAFLVVDATTERRSLHESFTSSTCPPCKPGNEMLASILLERLGKFSVINYQYFGPGLGDPYFTPESYNRGVYYGQSSAGTGGYSIPDLRVDGGKNINPNGYTTTLFDQSQTLPSLVSMTSSLTVTGKKVDVTVKVTPLTAIPAGNYKIRIAIVERTTKNNATTNGEIEFHYVMKKMLPTDAGTAFTFPAKDITTTINESFTFQGNYRLPQNARNSTDINSNPSTTIYAGVNLATEHSIEEFGNLAVVAFIQDETTKEVFQSTWSAQDWALGLTQNNPGELNFKVYPNPATSEFIIDYSGNIQNASVKIMDINGKEVLTQNISNLNNTIKCDNMQNGLYFVELNVDGKTAVKKLNIIR